MYVITNRRINQGTGLEVFGDTPNTKGPNELRLVQVEGSGKDLKVHAMDDKLDKAEVVKLASKFNLDINTSDNWYASLKVACSVFERAQKESKHVLMYVHGYNNDMKDILTAAQLLEKTYDVIVIPFSWPAKGGGVGGVTHYLGDKDHARISDTALNRAVKKVHFYHGLLTQGMEERARIECTSKYPDNNEKARLMYSRLIEKNCQMSVNLLCHSMGNYVLKYAIKPSSSGLRDLVFDNISLIAADVNNEDHAQWVQHLSVRNRVFVVINENDGALKWSRRKPGDAQKERLGHYLRNLTASNAYYLDVTRSTGVGSEHSYFKGPAVNNNATLKRVIKQA
ncbi:MAG: alpha/beta hydrolase, partial [Roseobacter sp.]|nr:alpha/beta hydrolase [Roseobacter sp.]